MRHLLSIVTFAPAAGALALVAVAPGRTAWTRGIATLSAAVSLSSSLLLWRGYHPRAAEWQFTEQVAWLPALGASYSVGIDGFSLLLVLLTTILGLAAVLTSWDSTAEHSKPRTIALLLLVTGLVGVFVALDFLLLLAFWIVTLSAMGVLMRQSERRTSVAVVVTIASSVCLLAGILALYWHAHALTGVWTFDIRSYRQLAIGPAVQPWALLAFAVALAIAAGAFPFHVWLLEGSRLPAGVAALFAAVLIKTGTYGFVRIGLPVLPDATRRFAPILLTVCLIGFVYAAAKAFAETDWRRIVGYTAAGHVSLSMLGALALTPEGLTGSMVHQVTQGISVAALFLLGGAIYDRASPWPAAGRAGSRPLATVLFVVAALAFACLPFSSGFVGARLIVRGVWPVGMVAGAVAVGGLLLSAGCLLWLVARTLRGTTGQLVPALAGVVRARDLAVALPIVAVAIWIGLHPAPLLWRLETAVARVVMRVSPQYAPQVADCLSAPPTPTVPDPSGLPAGMVLAAPCADESAADKRAPRKPQTPDR